jgi:hypothetical protein
VPCEKHISGESLHSCRASRSASAPLQATFEFWALEYNIPFAHPGAITFLCWLSLEIRTHYSVINAFSPASPFIGTCRETSIHQEFGADEKQRLSKTALIFGCSGFCMYGDAIIVGRQR